MGQTKRSPGRPARPERHRTWKSGQRHPRLSSTPLPPPSECMMMLIPSPTPPLSTLAAASRTLALKKRIIRLRLRKHALILIFMIHDLFIQRPLKRPIFIVDVMIHDDSCWWYDDSSSNSKSETITQRTWFFVLIALHRYDQNSLEHGKVDWVTKSHSSIVRVRSSLVSTLFWNLRIEKQNMLCILKSNKMCLFHIDNIPHVCLDDEVENKLEHTDQRSQWHYHRRGWTRGRVLPSAWSARSACGSSGVSGGEGHALPFLPLARLSSAYLQIEAQF